MHSFLVVSKNKKTALEYALNLCKKNQIDKFDIIAPAFEKAIGIEDVRNFQKQIILKPFKSKEKAVILETFAGITIEAQNALLKLLEEPPQHTIIILTTASKELLLPTILSRCKVIELKDNYFEPSKEESAQYLNILISLTSTGVGERLKLAQDIAKNKDDAIPWLERMIVVTRKKLIDGICHPEPFDSAQGKLREGSPESLYKASWDSSQASPDQNDNLFQYLNLLLSLTKTHTILKSTNVNPRLALENLFINI